MRTSLYNEHVNLKGKIIDFAGWELPIQYEGLVVEHNTVRDSAGLFDVSHMGEIEIKGNDTLEFVNRIITNNVKDLDDNQVAYSLMCYEDGGIVDDLLAYKISQKHFLLVVNAANIDKDFKWILENKKDYDIDISNISDSMGQLALQGPKAEEILEKISDTDLSTIKFFRFNREVLINNKKCLVSRTGYTGEDGFEIYTDPDNLVGIWNEILKAGEEYSIKPIGLGARDTLRFEATLPLYGHEISKNITPLEAGLGFFVKLDKDDFIGKEALVKEKQEGLKRKLVGFEMKGRGIPREQYDVLYDDKKIGFVTTGYFSPTLKKNIGLAMVDSNYSKIGTDIDIKIRKKAVKAEIISKRFLSKNYKK